MPADEAEAAALRVLDGAVAAMGGSRRDGQRRMTAAVARTIAGDGVLLAQAGTGTGKSLAYLAACLTDAAVNARTAVVSTATLALQRQVVEKDAPLVADAVAAVHGVRPAVAPLKGWHNYVCLHKLAGGYPDEDEPALFSMDASSARADVARSGLGEQVVHARTWAQETDTGDRDDMVPGVSDRAWRQLSVSRLECLGAACPLREDCFAEKARARAREADLVITNHAMLGIAASGSPGVLPEHDVLVVDEAHELVARVTSASTVELSAAIVERCARGAGRHAKDAVEGLQRAALALRGALDDVPDGRVVAVPPALLDATVLLAAAAREALGPLGGRAVDADDAGGRAVLKSQLVVVTEVCERLLSDSLAGRRDVAWVTRGWDGSQTPRILLAPLQVDRAIAEHLLEGRPAIATSATLALGGGFEPAALSFGLSQWEAEDFGSPFDFGTQGILYVAAHLPRPGRDGVSPQALTELGDLVEASGGGALGLFSSMRGAQRAAEYLRERLDTPVLCQGEEPVPGLVARFAADMDSSLMGTLSLWQGVDVPGNTCRLVVIDRIPFPRPDDPIAAARTEVAQSRGLNGFLHVSVAHAALLLAQGSGRLIRSSTDRGVVAILDSRIASASYGRFLLRSLPPLWPTTDGATVRSSLANLRTTRL
ncbi:MAG: ATP-dependent DNA helicase [Actinomycetes bacterium]|nr:ATP-dependent DNA helicase [Actinomycetes bacterium]MDX5380224.1 ATP-dependent DNA helicase [Actinomycetes bacterium]MDX5398911.1 ATP-dependent DNA helicase [Actinomycetes bacterium]MDX5449952.1 ATP-dependent DNA helicase [Actinomycetes bacterium]